METRYSQLYKISTSSFIVKKYNLAGIDFVNDNNEDVRIIGNIGVGIKFGNSQMQTIQSNSVICKSQGFAVITKTSKLLNDMILLVGLIPANNI
jgi:hypothetical protein